MTASDRAAIRWALRLLDGLLALTGCEIKPESRTHLSALRALAKPERKKP